MYIGVGKTFRKAAGIVGPRVARSVVQNRLRQRAKNWLGTVATEVNGSMILSSNPVGAAPHTITRVLPAQFTVTPMRNIGPVWQNTPAPVATPVGPAWPVSPVSQPWSAGGSPYGSQPSSTSLAVAQALLATNPGLLTQAQWTLLQQAGLVASTVPYSSAGLVNANAATSVDSSSAIDPATGVPYATELAAAQAGTSSDLGTTLDTTYGGLPLYMWLGVGVIGYLLFANRPSGRR
jgi:hypothetical protein